MPKHSENEELRNSRKSKSIDCLEKTPRRSKSTISELNESKARSKVVPLNALNEKIRNKISSFQDHSLVKIIDLLEKTMDVSSEKIITLINTMTVLKQKILASNCKNLVSLMNIINECFELEGKQKLFEYIYCKLHDIDKLHQMLLGGKNLLVRTVLLKYKKLDRRRTLFLQQVGSLEAESVQIHSSLLKQYAPENNQPSGDSPANNPSRSYDIIPFIFEGESEETIQSIEQNVQESVTTQSEPNYMQLFSTYSKLMESRAYDLLLTLFTSQSECGFEDDEAAFNNEFLRGLTFFKARKFSEALECFRNCESTLLTSLSLEPSLLVVNLSTIEFHCAEAFRILGQSKLAIEYYQKSLNSQNQESEIHQFDSSRRLKFEKLATALKDDDQISKSLKCLEEAIELSDEFDSISSLTSLANTLHHMGDHSAAIERYEQALEVAEKLKDVSSLSWLHGNLGNSYLSQGMKYKGLHYLKVALEDSMTHDLNPSSMSRVLNNLGTGYQAIGDTEQAEELYQKALSHAVLADDVIGQARARGNLGNIHLLKKEYALAVADYDETLNLTSDKSVAEVAHHNRGCAYYELGEQKRKAQQTLKDRRDNDFQFKSYGPHFHSTACDGLSAEDAFVLYSKSMCDFKKVFDQHESKFAEASSSVKNLDLFVCLFDTNSKTFSRAQDSAYAVGDHHSALMLAEQCRARTLAKHMLQQKSSTSLPLYAPLSLDQVVAIMHLQEPNVPVIVLSWTGNRLLGWILINDGKDVTMDTFEQEISKEAFDENSLDNYLRVKLNQLLSDGLDLEDESSSNEPLERKKKSSEVVNDTSEVVNETSEVVNDETSEVYKLFKLVGDPISEVISNAEKTKQNKKKRMILIPDSTLKLVPYSALSTSKGCMMGDQYSITFMPSILTLGIMSQTPHVIVDVHANKNDICIVGNPLTPPFSIDGTEWNLGPLPCSEEEAKWVGYYMRSKPLLRHEPTKNVVMDRLKTAKLIHLATHGSASRAFLVLAGDDKGIVQSPHELLLLYAADVQSLSLCAGLVVLTSCDSSRGVMKGDDIQGIARSFLLAGAQSVMTSIWKVPDKSACYFMQFFYRYLHDGFTSSEALSKASRSIRAFEEFSSMIHWSGYQITGKDMTMQCLTTNEDKLVEKMIGKRSPFPRLEVVTNLKDNLINQSSSNIQVLCGLSGVSVLEPIIDFAVDNHAHYPGGIAWINGCNENLLLAQFKILENVVSQDDPSLIIIDALSPELMDMAIQRVQDYPKASIIVQLPCLPGDEHLDAQTTRPLTTHDISVLTELQVTQRLVYHIETSHSLAAGKDEREALSYLCSLCYGSPFITQLMGCLIEKFSIRFDSPNEGIKAAYKCLKQNDTDCDSTRGLDYAVDSVLKCFIEEKFISIPSLILLRCLSLFGSLPIPESVVVAISEKIAEGQASSKCSPVMVSEIWRDVCSISLLHRYPTLITHPRTCDIPQTVNLYYIPETIADSISRTAVGLDKVICVATIHFAMDTLITDRLSSPSSPVLDCLYFPALLNIIRLIAPNVDMYVLEAVSTNLADTYFSSLL